ncbi:MAG: SseB family protein [Sandaracinaceae bacterium]
MTNPQTAAFHRLLSDAHDGGQAKIDAMVALVQRTVFVVPWPAGIEGFRTLVNSEGVAALPVFTLREELEEAARRFGWLAADGSAPSAEIGARNALNYSIQQNLSYVVIDIAADHALELQRAEFEPLLSEAARRDSQGPYAAAGKISTSLKQRVTPMPGTIQAQKPIAPPKSVPPGAMPASETPSAPGLSVSTGFDPSAATFGGGTSVSLAPLGQHPPDELYDALTTLLRNYPEVEWASLFAAARGPSAPTPTVGLRVDTSFRQRLNEIVGQVRQTGERFGASLDVLLLDDAELMRTARSCDVFYPWRKK